jgi:tRNA (guanine37-N1)-methyltransferase
MTGEVAESLVVPLYRVTLVTLFAEFFQGPLATSLLGKAIQNGMIQVSTINPREFAADRHHTVDDTPYGGGPGMVLKPDPMVQAIEAARQLNPGARAMLLTPQGARFDAHRVAELARLPGIILISGRYEGFDERIRSYIDQELSIGDYVLSGGEVASLVVLDAVARFIDGVLGNDQSRVQESFAEDLLEYPQYTRPPEYRGERVPDVLLSGDHGKIARWRRAQTLLRTRLKRPDLFERHGLTELDRRCLREFCPELELMEANRGHHTEIDEV